MVAALGGDQEACGRVERATRELRRHLTRDGQRRDQPSIGGLLALAYPDRVGQLRPGGHDRYRLANGRGVRMPADDPLTSSPYLVCAHLDAGQVEGRVFLAAAITLDEIKDTLAACLTNHATTFWDETQEAVVSRSELRLLNLVLAESPLPRTDPEEIRQAMTAGIKAMGIGVLPWSREARSLQARVGSLRAWQPDQGWPEISDEALSADLSWLAPYLDGMSRRRHLSRLDLLAILRAGLNWRLQNA